MIDNIRLKIDEVDDKLLELIIQRLDLVKQIGEIKKQNSLPVKNKQREQQLLDRLTKQAAQENIEPDIVKKIWKVLIEISYEIEGDKNGNN